MCFEGNRDMFLLSAFVPPAKDLPRFNHPLDICSQFKSVIGNYGKLNLICTLNLVFRVNTNKFKAMAFTLHERERKYLGRVTVFLPYPQKCWVILLPCLLNTKLGPTEINTFSKVAQIIKQWDMNFLQLQIHILFIKQLCGSPGDVSQLAMPSFSSSHLQALLPHDTSILIFSTCSSSLPSTSESEVI